MKRSLRNSEKMCEFDDESEILDILKNGSFSLTPRGYVRLNNHKKYNLPNQLFHRTLVGAKKGEVVDHIDGNPLNNRLSNLRICTQTQNTWNQGSRNPSSGYKGVYPVNKGKGWQARIRMFKKLVNIGYFQDKEEAAIAYNKAAKKLRGEFSVLNKIIGAE